MWPLLLGQPQQPPLLPGLPEPHPPQHLQRGQLDLPEQLPGQLELQVVRALLREPLERK